MAHALFGAVGADLEQIWRLADIKCTILEIFNKLLRFHVDHRMDYLGLGVDNVKKIGTETGAVSVLGHAHFDPIDSDGTIVDDGVCTVGRDFGVCVVGHVWDPLCSGGTASGFALSFVSLNDFTGVD